MTSPIVPSIGRVVLYYEDDQQTEPSPALVTKVFSDDCLNLMVSIDGVGTQPRTSVQHSETPIGGRRWHWMEYQKQAAAKA